ncbi:hypothetical protein GCM10027598_40520 [Amycolatopsis oliviviridis]
MATPGKRPGPRGEVPDPGATHSDDRRLDTAFPLLGDVIAAMSDSLQSRYRGELPFAGSGGSKRRKRETSLTAQPGTNRGAGTLTSGTKDSRAARSRVRAI